MTDRLAEIKERRRGVSCGWRRSDPHQDGLHDERNIMCNTTDLKDRVLLQFNQYFDYEADANFVASARADIDWLVAEVERLRVEYEPPLKYPPQTDCENCRGTGYYGDRGPGIKGNNEYAPCECTKKARENEQR